MTQPAETGRGLDLKGLPVTVRYEANMVLQLIERRNLPRDNWHIERTPEALNELIPTINKMAQEVFDRARPYKDGRNRWRDAVNKAWHVAAGRSVVLSRQKAWTQVYDRAARMLPSGDKYESLALAAAIETVGDQEIVTNPFQSMLRLAVSGADRVSFRFVRNENEEPKEMLVMNFPLILPRQKHIVGVLFREDGRRGDSVLGYVANDLDYEYSTLRPLIPARSILS